MPNLFVIAGPNGAGKSTSAPKLLTGSRRVAAFVNADDIAVAENVGEIEAGRIMLRRLDELALPDRTLQSRQRLRAGVFVPGSRRSGRLGISSI